MDIATKQICMNQNENKLSCWSEELCLRYKSVLQVGLMGLVEEEWIDTLSTIDPADIIFEDFVDVGNRLAKELREEVRVLSVYCRCNQQLMYTQQLFQNSFFQMETDSVNPPPHKKKTTPKLRPS